MNISIINDIKEIENNAGKDSINLLFTGDFCQDRKAADLIKSRDYD